MCAWTGDAMRISWCSSLTTSGFLSETDLPPDIFFAKKAFSTIFSLGFFDFPGAQVALLYSHRKNTVLVNAVDGMKTAALLAVTYVSIRPDETISNYVKAAL
jgi:hypothetical protein